MNIEHVTLLVKDYDETINFYTKIFQLELLEDTLLEPGKRWVLLGSVKTPIPSILLVKVTEDNQSQLIGNQTGNTVFLFFSTEDLQAFYDRLIIHKVTIVNGPFEEPWGKILKFKDLYGNTIEVIQPIK